MKRSILKEIRTNDRDGIPGVITYGLQYLEGNSDAHFTVTAWFKGYDKDHHRSEYGGCCHDEILALRPDLAPMVALHLSEETGVPMHAEANGWYWLAGAIGGMNEQYHGASGSSAQTPSECLAIFADHARITIAQAVELAATIKALPLDVAKAEFSKWINAQHPRWNSEAKSAIAAFLN